MSAQDGKSKLFGSSTQLQKASGIVSVIFAFISLGLIVSWMQGDDLKEGYLGGLNWKELIFNYHPIFMFCGMILFSLTALLSYRVLPLPKYMTKTFHAVLHSGALIFIILGLYAVIKGNNDPAYNTSGGYYPNLDSLHSFLGLSAVLLYFQNYIIGAVHFLMPVNIISSASRESYMPLHVFFGTFTLFAAAIAAQTGMMELITELGVCSYEVTSADLNPAENYHLLPDGCQLANGAGICLWITLLFAAYSLFNWNSTHRESLLQDTREL